MKKIVFLATILGLCLALTGCGTLLGAGVGGAVGGPRGAAIGAVAGAAFIDIPAIAAEQQRQQRQYYYQQLPPPPPQTCFRDQWNRIICQQMEPQLRVYYSEPPFRPAYPWRYWYTMPNQPGFVFFLGVDGKHRRHPMKHRK